MKFLTDPEQLNEIDQLSHSQPLIIFKHSTRCSVSNTVLSRFERDLKKSDLDPNRVYYLDLLTFRDISNEIASRYDVRHESPQSLLIKDGKCVYNASHLFIELDEIVSKF